jgi:hypothetical protein
MDREMELMMASCSLWDVVDEEFVVFYDELYLDQITIPSIINRTRT